MSRYLLEYMQRGREYCVTEHHIRFRFRQIDRVCFGNSEGTRVVYSVWKLKTFRCMTYLKNVHGNGRSCDKNVFFSLFLVNAEVLEADDTWVFFSFRL
ncbi:hypothetical protein TWF594_011510 [Orbilia oligospora]|nr:hypothetical protein TWF594_011510 [Orbilia oligospora]